MSHHSNSAKHVSVVKSFRNLRPYPDNTVRRTLLYLIKNMLVCDKVESTNSTIDVAQWKFPQQKFLHVFMADVPSTALNFRLNIDCSSAQLLPNLRSKT